MPRQEIRDQHETGWFPSFSRKAWVESIPFVIKSQLVLNVAVQLRSIRQRAVAEAVDAIFDRMGSALAHGDRVELRGFGSFSVNVREGHAWRNPRTGATVNYLKGDILLSGQASNFASASKTLLVLVCLFALPTPFLI